MAHKSCCEDERHVKTSTSRNLHRRSRLNPLDCPIPQLKRTKMYYFIAIFKSQEAAKRAATNLNGKYSGKTLICRSQSDNSRRLGGSQENPLICLDSYLCECFIFFSLAFFLIVVSIGILIIFIDLSVGSLLTIDLIAKSLEPFLKISQDERILIGILIIGFLLPFLTIFPLVLSILTFFLLFLPIQMLGKILWKVAKFPIDR